MTSHPRLVTELTVRVPSSGLASRTITLEAASAVTAAVIFCWKPQAEAVILRGSDASAGRPELDAVES